MKQVTGPKKSLACRMICTCYHCPRTVACAVFGKNSKPHHRILTGLAIIAVGAVVGDMQIAAGVLSHILQGCCSRFVEAMGFVPIIEHLGKIANAGTVEAISEAAITSAAMTTEAAMDMENAINGIPTKQVVEPTDEHSNLTQLVS